jgi:2-C-methyl-D-erythritol 4-phosphate cytidylyltransferase
MKLAVIIPAGGTSTRFGEKDKLFEDVGGRPLLIRTVEFFTKREDVSEIVVAGPADTFESFKERFGPSLAFHGVKIIPGGPTRGESVRNALQLVSDSIEFVAVHDAARPALSEDLFDRLLLACSEFVAVVPGLPIYGTVKRAEGTSEKITKKDAVVESILGASSQPSVDACKVLETIDRTNLWEMQTPQCFSLSLLKRGYAQDSALHCTDEAQVIENLGEPVYLIKGDSRNIKVTTQEDYQLVKAILGAKGKAERPAHKRF